MMIDAVLDWLNRCIASKEPAPFELDKMMDLATSIQNGKVYERTELPSSLPVKT